VDGVAHGLEILTRLRPRRPLSVRRRPHPRAYASLVNVLLTGMSGTGKSTLIRELRRRGHAAHDADDGYSEPRAEGRWGWRVDAVAELLATASETPLFFAGCAEEQAELPFDYRILLTLPEPVLVERLRTRTTNSYGRGEEELQQVLRDREQVEPLLRRSADLVLTSTVAPRELADAVLERLSGRSAPAGGANRSG
jgi:dephospho-CoA kinase